MRRLKTSARAAILAAAALALPCCTDDIGNGDQFGIMTARVSVDLNGAETLGGSNRPSISADGRYVAFASDSVNLTEGDTNGKRDIFIKDRLTGRVRNITNTDQLGVIMDDCDTPAISPDGLFVAFVSKGNYTNDFNIPFPNPTQHIFVYDIAADIFRSIWIGFAPIIPDSDEGIPSISNGGQYLVFNSNATNIVAGYAYPPPPPMSAANQHVYLCDFGAALGTRTLTLISSDETTPATVAGDGSSVFAKISADGEYVVFMSNATNLINASDSDSGLDVYLWQRNGGTRTLVSTPASGGGVISTWPSISADGGAVSYSHRVNAATNLTRRWLRAGAVTTDVSDPSVYIGNFDPSSISDDGQTILYTGASPASLNSQVFVWNAPSANALVSRSSGGALGNKNSFGAAISGNGKWGAWETTSSNLVAGDTNGASDVYVRGPLR